MTCYNGIARGDGQAQPRKGVHAVVRGMNPLLYHKGGEGMDWEGIVKIVQSLGFPIACVIAMFCMWQREVSSHKEEMESMRKTMEEQNKATVEALNNNTQVLNRILQKIGE